LEKKNNETVVPKKQANRLLNAKMLYFDDIYECPHGYCVTCDKFKGKSIEIIARELLHQRFFNLNTAPPPTSAYFA
jgi:hypothetical protein